MIMYLLLQFRAIYMQMRSLMETQYHNNFVYNDKNSLFYDYKSLYDILFAYCCRLRLQLQKEYEYGLDFIASF